MPKKTKRPTRTKNVTAHEKGMLPDRTTYVADSSLFSLGSSWKTTFAGLFQFWSLKARRAPSATETLLPAVLKNPKKPPDSCPIVTTISFPGGLERRK